MYIVGALEALSETIRETAPASVSITAMPRLTNRTPSVGWSGHHLSKGVLMSRRYRVECVLIIAVPVGYAVIRALIKTVWGV